MAIVTQATDTDRVSWDNFVAASDEAEPYHPYEWRKVFERVFSHKCYYLIARDNENEIVGLLPLVQLKSLIFGNFLTSVPCFSYGGTLTNSDCVRNELVSSAWKLAGELGAKHVELRHRSRITLELPYREEKVAMQLNLPSSCEALWKGFSSKLRAQIRRPGKEGATAEEGGISLVDEFYAVFARNMRDLGTPVYPKSLFEQMCRSFPQSVRIFVVRMGGLPCAAGITDGFRDRLEIPSASSLREYNRESVNMLLYWTVLQYAVREGYKQFDFGRSTANSGTFRFKKQWGAKPDPLRWHYCLSDGDELPALNPQNPKFRIATRVWQKLPLSVANTLGPRIVRSLP